MPWRLSLSGINRIASAVGRASIVMALGVGVGTAWLVGDMLSSGSSARRVTAGSEESAPLALLENTGVVFGRVADVVAPAVVYIEAQQKEKDGGTVSQEAGSGVFVKPGNLTRPVVVTNLHVVAHADPKGVEVILADGRLLNPSRILEDEDTDLAVLEFSEENLPSATFAPSAHEVRVGQWVLAIGSPFGLMQSVTHGIVSATQRRRLGLPQSMRIKEFIQTDAAINPGSSGGPLVNLRGEIVGVNTAIASHTGGSSGVGFAIPSPLVQQVVEELVAHGRVRRAFLGVEFPHLFTHDRSVELGLISARGALVAGVGKGSPAAQAGIREGDVVLEFNGQAVADDSHLINLVSRSAPGQKVEMIVWRGKKRVSLAVTLGEWIASAVAKADRTN
ncbi:trypsin-like peptidase domain-containing protein [bacterium]|nr:trypsin-like peptidase domain-containing protein [bacterium]